MFQCYYVSHYVTVSWYETKGFIILYAFIQKLEAWTFQAVAEFIRGK